MVPPNPILKGRLKRYHHTRNIDHLDDLNGNGLKRSKSLLFLRKNKKLEIDTNNNYDNNNLKSRNKRHNYSSEYFKIEPNINNRMKDEIIDKSSNINYPQRRKYVIQKDNAGHGGRKWKLKDHKDNRIASLGADGEILAD